MLAGFAPIDSFPHNRRDPDLMMRRDCPVCRLRHEDVVVEFPDFQFFTDSAEQPKIVHIQQVHCRHCHAYYMNPCYSPEGFAVLFAQAGMTYGASEMRKQEQLGWLRARDLLRPGSLLMDVGCYTGDFISVLPDEVKAVGVDIDPAIIERARKAVTGPNRRFLAADLTGFSFDERVDTFTMFHVLEHLPHPRAVLEQLRRIARPETRLVVEVPLLEKGKTNDINGYLTVSHLTHFSLRTLEICLETEGWQIVDRTDQPDYNGYRVLAKPADPFRSDDDKDPRQPYNRGDAGDLDRLHDYLIHWYRQRDKAEERLDAVPPAGRCVLWGAGFHTELIYNLTRFFSNSPERRYLLVDSDPTKQGRTWRGVPIVDSSELENLDWTQTNLLLSSYGSQEVMTNLALEMGVPEEKIFRIYDTIRRY
ncbi:MAG: class I SAM-dependent methyltransferase [Acidobacteriota bacterium]|nr:class I SAM-dependent methyltransferase [Acidobacteriota bacterium]